MAQKWYVDFSDPPDDPPDVLKECLVLSVTSVVGDISAPTVPSVIISAKANVGSREVRWS